eukprot:TRINITY_DN20258_c0_g2_i1.p1 TRINITY_DN20258_c0_g2~~TRINITY_DN20258_c0_g2_i1.p1  ORF type:complete len:489 (+),score=112.17 TRINITY_DN20258_c0_g2_i1:76-1467(+)
MASELLGTLSSRRSMVDSAGQTWESQPATSSADARAPLSPLDGLALGAGVSVKEWLAQRLDEMPEEDPLREALSDIVGGRGQAPAHAPAKVTGEDAALLKSLVENVTNLQRKLEAEKKGYDQGQKDLQRREEELQALESRLAREREQQRLREEARTNYPQPAWLENVEGTVNVAVVGNSGVGKSLLINKLRRVSGPHAENWAPVGVRETTFVPTMYTFAGEARVRLWDLPGAGTERFPQATYIQEMGLRYFDSVLIVTAGRFTSTETELSKELNGHGVPYYMVRTKVDLDVWNNMHDNMLTEDATLRQIQKDLRERGVQDPYLVSSRDPDKYDLTRLLCNAFPGLKERLDATSFLFAPAEAKGWNDGWSMPQLVSRLAAGIQGQWTDSHTNTLFMVDGSDVHITTADQKTAVVPLVEDEGKLWWMNHWYVSDDSVRNSRQSGELRWTPTDIVRTKPYIWRWSE